jgi:5-formyltetrahydrofolate cyclo-ligase
MSMSLAELKRQARSRAAKHRDAIHPQARAEAGAALAARGLPDGLKRAIASGFHPYLSEISVLELFGRLALEGWITALPVVVGKSQPLIFRRWAPGETLVSGLWDIQVPPETSPEVLPDVLLVPMLAFDRRGFRLGYGGGFYDRTLAKLRAVKEVAAIGVAYSAQEVDEVPRDGHDQPMDWIMTEEKTIRCG